MADGSCHSAEASSILKHQHFTEQKCAKDSVTLYLTETRMPEVLQVRLPFQVGREVAAALARRLLRPPRADRPRRPRRAHRALRGRHQGLPGSQLQGADGTGYDYSHQY